MLLSMLTYLFKDEFPSIGTNSANWHLLTGLKLIFILDLFPWFVLADIVNKNEH